MNIRYRLAKASGRAKHSSSLQGVALICLSTFLFALMDGIVKCLLNVGYTPYQILFFRGLFGLIPAYHVLRRSGGFSALKTKKPQVHFIRCFLAVLGSMGYYIAACTLPLANLYAIEFLSPLMMVFLSIYMLKEPFDMHRIAAATIGFFGALILIRPGYGAFQIAYLFAIGGRICFAFASVLIKQLSVTETKIAVAIYYLFMCIAFNGLIMPFVWITPTWTELLMLMALGIIGGVAHLCITFAFYVAPVAVVAPFEYTALLWATLTGYMIWGDLPDGFVWLGSAILIVSGLYIVHRERLSMKKKKLIPSEPTS
jgi:drug/metabolite transporter (DMT)-like permease